MSSYQILWGLLVLATGFTDAVVATCMDRTAGTATMLFLGLSSGQLALLTAWCVWGKRNWTLRLGSTAAWACVLAAPLSLSMGPPWSEWLGLFYLHSVLVAVLLLCPDWQCWSRMRNLHTLLRSRETLREFPFHFSLQNLFAVMVTVAILLAAVRRVSLPQGEFVIVWGYAASLAVIGVLAMRLLTKDIRWTIQIVLLAGACLACGWAMTAIGGLAEPGPFTIIAVTQTTMIGVGMIVWRQSRNSLSANRSGT
jgi:hypothetical protein